MGDLRKDRTRKQGALTKTHGRSDGLKANGKVRTQDTGKPPGGVKPKNKQIKSLGQR